MLGSVIISACLQNGTLINIKHTVIEGSPQWVIGRNVKIKCEINHSKGNYLKLASNAEVPLENIDLNSHITSLLFLNKNVFLTAFFQAKIYCDETAVSDFENTLSRKEAKKIIDKVQSMFLATRA